MQSPQPVSHPGKPGTWRWCSGESLEARAPTPRPTGAKDPGRTRAHSAHRAAKQAPRRPLLGSERANDGGANFTAREWQFGGL